MKRRVISLFLAVIFAFMLGAAAWADAEPAPEASEEPAPEASEEPEPEASAEPEPEASAEPEPEASAEPAPEASTEPKPEASTEPEPETSEEPKPETDEEIAPAAEEPVTGNCGSNVVYEIIDGTLTIRVEDPSSTYSSDVLSFWSNKDGWYEYADQITKAVVEDGVDVLYENVFRDLPNLASVDIAESVERIGPYAFQGCASSLTVTIRNPFCMSSIYQDGDELTIFPADATVCAYEHSWMYDLAGRCGCTVQSLGQYEDGGSWTITWGGSGSGSWTLTGDGLLTISGSGTIGMWATSEDPIYGNQLAPFVRTLVIQEGITAIQSGAFSYFERLTSAVIPSSVKTVEAYAFSSCPSLTEVQNTDGAPWTGAGVTVDPSAFSGTPWMNSHVDGSGFVIFNGALVNYIGTDANVVIPDGVTCIGTCAFSDTAPGGPKETFIESVVIPPSVREIQSEAFRGCKNLKSVKFSEGLTSIGWCSFEQCTALTEIDLPQSLTAIGRGAFANCSSLARVNIPAGATMIGGGAFCGTALTSVTIPEGVSYIEYAAFADCRSLASVSLPQSLKTIETEVFDGTALTEVTIPESVASLGKVWCGRDSDGGVFNSCSALRSITIENRDCDMTLADETGENHEIPGPDYSPPTLVPDSLHTRATIRGHAGSTASAYAKEHGYTFVSIDLPAGSDTTGDGKTDLADVTILFERLCDLSAGGTAAVPDLCEDGKSDLKDITALYQLVSPAQG